MEKRAVHITGNHAVRLMRMVREGKLDAVPTRHTHLEAQAASLRSIEDLDAPELLASLKISPTNPLKVLVPDARSRSWVGVAKSLLYTEVLSAELPQGAFLRLQETGEDGCIHMSATHDVYISAPGIMLIEAARDLARKIPSKAPLKATSDAVPDEFVDLQTGTFQTENHDPSHEVTQVARHDLRVFLRLLEFVDECCGYYHRDSLSPRSSPVQYDEFDKPTRLCDLKELTAFLAGVRGMDGLPLARRVARYAIDGSGSCMETYINHALTLPPRLAGLSMKRPLANRQIVTDAKTRQILRHKSLRPDLQWPDYKTLAEYLGDKEHAGRDARIEDKNRMQDYAAASYAAMPLMYDDVNNATSLNNTALRLAREFAKHGAPYEMDRLKKLMRDDEFMADQRILVAALLPPITRYGV